jgi:hypothetical protein
VAANGVWGVMDAKVPPPSSVVGGAGGSTGATRTGTLGGPLVTPLR